jgi:hypothetical protein
MNEVKERPTTAKPDVRARHRAVGSRCLSRASLGLVLVGAGTVLFRLGVN